ncbi:MAG: hypothetical protein HZB22_01205 [Deltaproteobacteria bacterium]|nr:hypothetical protein [Deltaproteobacteria bacterium]
MSVQIKKNRRVIAWVCILGVVFLLSPLSTHSGEYHNPKQNTFLKTTETLACSQCHTMHGTQGGQSMIYGGAATVYPYLLRAATIVQLCRTCHENNSLSMSNPTPPDIWNMTLGYTASAGDFANGGFENEQNRHSVGQTNVTPPGSNPTITIPYFSCINCHDQHGNTNYRNLKKRPGNASSDITVSYTLDGGGTCSDGSATPCDINDVTTTGQGTTANLYKYNRGNVTFRKATASNGLNGIAPWCGGCHTNFHGAGGASNIGGAVGGDTGLSPWLRHPVRDVNIDQGNADLHADRSNWASLSSTVRTRAVNPDNLDPTSSSADEQPFCLSCHYAHGGGNPNYTTDATLDHSNLVFIDGSGKINIDSTYTASTGRIRNLCEQCHNQ